MALHHTHNINQLPHIRNQKKTEIIINRVHPCFLPQTFLSLLFFFTHLSSHFPVICTILSNFCPLFTKPRVRVMNHWSVFPTIQTLSVVHLPCLSYRPFINFNTVETKFARQFWGSILLSCVVARKEFLAGDYLTKCKMSWIGMDWSGKS